MHSSLSSGGYIPSGHYYKKKSIFYVHLINVVCCL